MAKGDEKAFETHAIYVGKSMTNLMALHTYHDNMKTNIFVLSLMYICAFYVVIADGERILEEVQLIRMKCISQPNDIN